MKITPFLVFLGVLVFLSSCSPRISSSITKNYPALDSLDEVAVLEVTEKIPANTEKLGEVKIGDTGFTTKCDFETVLKAAKVEARRAGGNLLKITVHTYPDLASSCHRITATIYKVTPLDVATPLTVNTPGDSTTQSIQPVQEPVRDTIEIIKAGGGYKYKFNDQLLTLNSFEEVVLDNSTATEYFKKAKGTSGFISVLGYAGGFLIGYPIGTALGGGKANWTLAAVGCGLVAIAIPIASSADKNLLKAARAYNEGKPISKVEPYDIRVGVNQNGLALAIRF